MNRIDLFAIEIENSEGGTLTLDLNEISRRDGIRLHHFERFLIEIAKMDPEDFFTQIDDNMIAGHFAEEGATYLFRVDLRESDGIVRSKFIDPDQLAPFLVWLHAEMGAPLASGGLQ